MKVKMLFFVLVSLTAVATNAFKIETGADAPEWLRHIQASPAVYKEMQNYFLNKDLSVQAYVKSFIPQLHSQMVAETEKYFHSASSNSCTPFFEATLPKQITSDFSFGSKEDFEDDFVVVQSNDCLGKLDIEKVFQTLQSEQFQRNVIEGIKSIEFKPGDRVCIKTSTFFLSTNYCVAKKFFVNEGKTQYVIQSFNDENKSGADPIYFKDTINVITQLPNGEVSFYNLMYARANDIPGIAKGKVLSKVKETQARVRKYLIELAQ